MNHFLGKIPTVPLDAKAILEVARTQRPDLYAAVMRVASDFCCGCDGVHAPPKIHRDRWHEPSYFYRKNLAKKNLPNEEDFQPS